MLRRILMVLTLLALSLATASPALADKPPGKPEWKPTAKPEARPAVAAFRRLAFQGTIEDIKDATDSEATWVVKTVAFGDVSVKVTTDTKVKWPGVKDATFKAFEKGDRVAVKLQRWPQGDQPYLARQVHLIPGKIISHFTGKVTGFADGKLTVEGKSETKEFAVSADFPVRAGREVKKVSDLKSGDLVTVVTRVSSGSVLAIKLHGPNEDD